MMVVIGNKSHLLSEYQKNCQYQASRIKCDMLDNLWLFAAHFATTTRVAIRASRYSSANIVTSLPASWPKCLHTPSRVKKVLCISHSPGRLCDPLRHLFNQCQEPGPGAKRPERDADHFCTFSVQFKNAWKYTSRPQQGFLVLCLIKDRDSYNFKITF